MFPAPAFDGRFERGQIDVPQLGVGGRVPGAPGHAFAFRDGAIAAPTPDLLSRERRDRVRGGAACSCRLVAAAWMRIAARKECAMASEQHRGAGDGRRVRRAFGDPGAGRCRRRSDACGPDESSSVPATAVPGGGGDLAAGADRADSAACAPRAAQRAGTAGRGPGHRPRPASGLQHGAGRQVRRTAVRLAGGRSRGNALLLRPRSVRRSSRRG